MKWTTAATGATIFWAMASAGQADESTALGNWVRGDGNAKVRIAPCGSDLCATNTWIRDTSKGEAVGDKLVMTVQAKSPGTMAGKAYDPKRGLTYSITIKAEANTLSTRGCLVGVICRTVSWARAD